MNNIYRTTLAIIFSASFLSAELIAQTQIPNGGFENWANVGSNDEEPVNWNSNKTGGGNASLGPQTCWREDSDVYAGSYCLYLRTRNFFGIKINGTATTGRIEAPTLDPLDGYIRTLRNDADFNSPFTGRPDSLVGYFKYNSENGDDGSLAVVLHGDYDVESPDQGGSAPFMIADATFITPNSDVNTWTRFSVPFVYTSPDTPQYILSILTSSSVPGAGETGSELWVDELEVIYNPPCTSSDSFMVSACDSYTSPSGNYTWNSSGTYLDTIPNAAQCDSFLTIMLEVDTLTATVNQSGFTLTAEATDAEYQWLDCADNNSPIGGATGQSFTATENGEYAVMISRGTCVDTSDCFVIDAVSVEDLLKQKIELFPNPATDILHLSLSDKAENIIGEIYDLQGRRLLSQTRDFTDELEFHVRDLAPGVYFIKVNTPDGTVTLKWVKD
jgi:hypothetical protein